MSEKYFVIMEGGYSSTCVVGVTTSLEIAEAYCRVHNAKYKGEYYWVWDSDGTELITDTNYIEQAKKIKKAYVFRANKWKRNGVLKWSGHLIKEIYEEAEGPVIQIKETSFEREKEIYIYTEDQKKASKIFRDCIAKLNAEEQGL